MTKTNVDVAVNAVGAYYGGIVRVLERFALAATEDYNVGIWYAPNSSSLLPEQAIKSRQSASRKRTFARILLDALSPSRAKAAVRVDISPGPLPSVEADIRVIVVHDLGFMHEGNPNVSFSQKVYRKLVLGHGLMNSDLIISNSQQTSGEILQFFPRIQAPIVTLPLPVDHVFESIPPAEVKRGSGGERKTILAFGHARNKGIETLLEVLALRDDYRLRVISPRAFWETTRLPGMVDNMEIGTRVEVLDGLTDAELIREYLSADLFCMPSTYEGYGLPVAEALACQAPTVISDLDVLESTGRGYAVRARGGNAVQLAEACEKALTLPDEHWKKAAAEFRQWTWHTWTSEILRLAFDLRTDSGSAK